MAPEWVKGQLERVESGHLALWHQNQHWPFDCGQWMELLVRGRWLRGRVEHNNDVGWYWTNDRFNRRLHPGDEIRVWTAAHWPPPERYARDGSGRDR